MRLDQSGFPKVRGLVGGIALLALGLSLQAVVSSFALADTGAEASARIALATRAASSYCGRGAGLSASSFGDLSAAVESSDEFAACASADEAMRDTEANYAALREQIWRRGGSSQDLATLADLRQNTAAAQAASDQALADLREFALDELVTAAGESDADLAMCMQANLGRHVPVAALCLDLTEQQWSALEAALSKRAAGATLTQAEQAVATIYDSSADVVLVASRLAASQTEYDAYIATLAAEIQGGE